MAEQSNVSVRNSYRHCNATDLEVEIGNRAPVVLLKSAIVGIGWSVDITSFFRSVVPACSGPAGSFINDREACLRTRPLANATRKS